MNPVINDEQQRLVAVRRFEKFEFNLNKSLNGILQLAAYIYETPVAFITLIDEQHQLFKVNRGFDVIVMPRNTSFCTHAITQDSAMIVNDAFLDERFANNPLVLNAPNIRFYAGAPLATKDGLNVGTLCVMDTTAKQVSDDKKELLDVLAKQAINLMELEVMYTLLNEKVEQIEIRNKVLMNIANVQSHEFRAPLCNIMSIMELIKDDNYESSKEYMLMMEDAVKKLDEKIHLVVQSTEVAQSTSAH